LRAVGAKVLNEAIKSEDVTGQVVDLDARIANAKASELRPDLLLFRTGRSELQLEEGNAVAVETEDRAGRHFLDLARA
jgi:hypothetical protein